jgi:RNA polymerase nonessential primary-like sigma factor
MSATYINAQGTDGFGQYLKSIGRYDLLTTEEEYRYSAMVYRMVELEKNLKEKKLRREEVSSVADILGLSKEEVDKIYNEGNYGRQKMVNHNLRLVISIAKKYNNRGVDLTDLVQEGNIGLSKAVYKFNPHMGYKFSTYGSWWIKQAIARAVATHNRKIRLPMHIYDILNKIKRATRELSQIYGRQATMAEVAVHLDMKKEKLLRTASYCRKVLSLDSPIYDTEDLEICVSQFLGDTEFEEEINVDILKHKTSLLLSLLTDNERYVLVHKYGINDEKIYTFKEIAENMGVHLDRVKKLKISAFNKIRDFCIHEEIELDELGVH